MNKLFLHDWDAVDSEGYTLECSNCDTHVSFYNKDYDTIVDSVCKGRILLLRYEEAINALSDDELLYLEQEINRASNYNSSTNILKKFNKIRTISQSLLDNLNDFHFPTFEKVFYSVLIARLKKASIHM